MNMEMKSNREIKEKLLELKEIYEAVVIGVDDPILGEAIKAFIVFREDNGFIVEWLRRELSHKLPILKILKYYVFCNSLPKNESAKILKTKLK